MDDRDLPVIEKIKNETIEALDSWKLRQRPEVLSRVKVWPQILFAWNHKLIQTAGRISWGKVEYETKEELIVLIELASRYFDEFGYDRVKTTALHELAHYICIYAYGERSHSLRFKHICAEIGGSMNWIMAGTQFESAGTDQFLRNHKVSYHCPCGKFTIHRSRRIKQKALFNYCCRKCHTPMNKWTMTLNDNNIVRYKREE